MARAARLIAPILAAAVALTPLPGAAQDADCPVVELDGPVRRDDLAGKIAGLTDPDWALTAGTIAGQRFERLTTDIPDYGYTRSKIWLRLCIRNTTETQREWRLHTHENFYQVYEVHIARDGALPQTITALQQDSPFSDRPVNYSDLVTPFELEPGQSATIYIAYWSGGSSQIDFAIETKESFEDRAATATAKNFFFYGMMILLILVALASLAVFRNPVFLAYCAYTSAALLFLMHEDGIAFQFLWPNAPAFNSNASIVAGSGLIVFGAVYARIFLRTFERHPRTDKVLLGFIVLTLVLDVAMYSTNPQLLKKLLIMLSLLSFLSFTTAGFIAYFSGHREVRFYLIAWLGVVLSSLLMNLRHVMGLEIPQEVVHDSMRAVMVFDASMMGLAIADRYNQLRQSRQAALEESLDAAQQTLNLNRRLDALQARHELAVQLSKTRDQQIQNVVHDLRQPLHALRLNVTNLNTGAAQPGSAGKIESAFSYLERLISEHLDVAPEDEPDPVQQDDRPLDALGLPDILAAVEEMFRPDAEAKGLTLRRVPGRHEADADPLVLTRILSNLVSNAVKYTDAGGILIGTRGTGDAVRVEVHDTGPGMTAEEFDEAKKRRVRLEKGVTRAEGKGLGLAIAIELARRNGMELSLSPLRRSGTGMVLTIPRTAGAEAVA